MADTTYIDKVYGIFQMNRGDESIGPLMIGEINNGATVRFAHGVTGETFLLVDRKTFDSKTANELMDMLRGN